MQNTVDVSQFYRKLYFFTIYLLRFLEVWVDVTGGFVFDFKHTAVEY